MNLPRPHAGPPGSAVRARRARCLVLLAMLLVPLTAAPASAELSMWKQRSGRGPGVSGGWVRRLRPAERASMTGVSWRPGCPVGLDDLRVVEVAHLGFDGRMHAGRIVVRKDVAETVRRVFHRLRAERFPIREVTFVDRYGADDDRAMAADATTAFNCRKVAGTDRWSEHAYGTAIDLNPVENPYVDGSYVAPPAGAAFTTRADVRPGMAVAGSAPVRAFDAAGWGWGGRFRSIKDWQHFSSSGR